MKSLFSKTFRYNRNPRYNPYENESIEDFSKSFAKEYYNIECRADSSDEEIDYYDAQQVNNSNEYESIEEVVEEKPQQKKSESVLSNQKLDLKPVMTQSFVTYPTVNQHSLTAQSRKIIQLIDSNQFGYYEIQNAIGQYGNSCWLNSCLNLLSLIPNLITTDSTINGLLNRIRGKNTMNYQAVITAINGILKKYNKTVHQFEACDGMEILKSLIKSASLEICVYEFPDYVPLKKFLVMPYGVVDSFNSARTDIIQLTNAGQGSADYQPIAWIFRRGNLNNGHFTVIYMSELGELFEIDSLSQTVEEIDDFPKVTDYNTIEYALYVKL